MLTVWEDIMTDAEIALAIVAKVDPEWAVDSMALTEMGKAKIEMIHMILEALQNVRNNPN